jgi:hypothetical protein
MSDLSVEERLATLEAEVASLKAEVARLKEATQNETEAQKPWWEERFGAFKDDPVYAEITRLGRKYRESLRPKDANEERPRLPPLRPPPADSCSCSCSVFVGLDAR